MPDTIFLAGITPAQIIEKYNLDKQKREIIPKNTTKIEELELMKEKPEVVSFLDESKQIKKCNFSMIDLNTHENIHKKRRYKCFWDKEIIPESILPIGCPIKYMPDKAKKVYFSEISKDTYRISEQITQERYEELENRKDSRISLEKNNYYETDGVFCSFNCLFAWIKAPENKTNPLYINSETLAYKMYSDIFQNTETVKILPAPHWRLLESFGGYLNIEKFRSTFNKVLYENVGSVSCKSIAFLFENNVRL